MTKTTKTSTVKTTRSYNLRKFATWCLNAYFVFVVLTLIFSDNSSLAFAAKLFFLINAGIMVTVFAIFLFKREPSEHLFEVVNETTEEIVDETVDTFEEESNDE